MKTWSSHWLSLALAALALSCISGCKTTEEDLSNSNERPWNTPKNWESGLPSSIYEGR
jgi:hypothetical protein